MDFIIKLFLNAIAVVITAYLLPGVHLQNFGYAVLLAAVLSLLNVSLKPILIVLTIPATIFTLGLFLLVINALMILVADWIITDGFNVDGFWWALAFSLILSFINSVFNRLTVKPEHRNDSVQIFDKDGNRIG
ncbi:MAG: phage holin family protein [Bacteroidetes bacterium]|jgi:putative membrane protein|nr:phage holin family protein [Bacteroidota bacterium]